MRLVRIVLLGVGIAACLVALGQLLPLTRKASEVFAVQRLNLLVSAVDAVQVAAGVMAGWLLAAGPRRSDLPWIAAFHVVPAAVVGIRGATG